MIDSDKCTRPSAHFTPSRGWMNDPNGLVYFEGEYHLFYQHNPDSMTGGAIHWGHAVSADLHNWEELNIALAPDELGMCFSGSAIVDHHNDSGLFPEKSGLLAFYTAHREAVDFDRGYIEEQCLAYSRDNGRTWKKYEANPIIKSPGYSDIRDPKVTRYHDSNTWIMSLAVGQQIHFYRSENLIDWQFCSAFGDGQGAHTDHPWECPDLFELPIEGTAESRWVLVVGIGACDKPFGSFTQYFIGDFNGTEFINENPADRVLMMDEGRDFYAVQTWSDSPDNTRRAIAWMSNWKYAKEIPAEKYRGVMTSVRTLRLVRTNDGIRLAQSFDMDQNPESKKMIAVDTDSLAVGKPVNLGGSGCMSFDLESGSEIELSLNQGAIAITRTQDTLQVRVQRQANTENSHFDSCFAHDYDLETPWTGELRIEWIKDLDSIEILINQGVLAITQRELPSIENRSPRLYCVKGKCLNFQEYKG